MGAQDNSGWKGPPEELQLYLPLGAGSETGLVKASQGFFHPGFEKL